MSDAIERAKRDVRAAGALFRSGLLPESHGYLMRALHAALDAWTAADGARAPDPSEEQALAALTKQGYRESERVRSILAAERATAATAAPEPRLPSDFEETWAAIERLVSFSERQLRPDRIRRRRRRFAVSSAALALLLVTALGVRLWGRVRARASASISPEGRGAYAVDGIDTTEWILPDDQLGWLDVYLPRAKEIRSVVVLNGHDRFYMDRAAKRVRVTAYAEHRELGAAEGQFPGIRDGRSALTLKLHARGATRLRLEVLSYYGAGSAIAELEID